MVQEAARRLLDRFEACSRVAGHRAGWTQDIGSGAGRGPSGRG
jgi:hypothetical protein